MAGDWRLLLERLNEVVADLPDLEASAQPFSAASLPETRMIIGGTQAFCVEIPATVDAGERQRKYSTDGHTITISICTAINTSGAWATSLGRVMDTEQRIRDRVLSRKAMTPYRMRWGGVSRALTADRAHIVSTIAFTADHETEVNSGL